MTTNVAAVRVPTPNADTAANARTEGRGLQNPEREAQILVLTPELVERASVGHR